jgi:hypothetical protein
MLTSETGCSSGSPTEMNGGGDDGDDNRIIDVSNKRKGD